MNRSESFWGHTAGERRVKAWMPSSVPLYRGVAGCIGEANRNSKKPMANYDKNW